MLSSDIFHDGPPPPLFPQGGRRNIDPGIVLAEVVRLEGLLATEASWPLPVWRRRYLDHPLRRGIARRLIWEFRRPGEERLLFPDTAIWRGGRLLDVRLAPLAPLPDDTRVRLWHTLNSNWGTLVLWRERFTLDGVVTPIEQAHRLAFYPEPQELKNGTRADRFAGHVVRRDEVCALGRRRGWRHRPPQRPGDAEALVRTLIGTGLRAEFGLWPLTPDGASDATKLYLGTGAVVFRGRGGGRRTLSRVPGRAFSEALRDAYTLVLGCGVFSETDGRPFGTLGRYVDVKGKYGDLRPAYYHRTGSVAEAWQRCGG